MSGERDGPPEPAARWQGLFQLLDAHRRFLITTHVHLDGDAIGAQVALALVLEELGKETLLVNDDPVPRIYRFLDPRERVRAYAPDRDEADIAACDAAIVVDVGALDRIGRLGPALARLGVPLACIDHHATNGGFARVNVVDSSASSTSALVLDLIRALGQRPGQAVAEALFVGLATDTGWFRFANAGPPAFRDAAELVACGASPPRLYELIYEDLTWARTRLLARTLATLRPDGDGRIAYATITREMFEQTGARDEEVEGFVDKLREVGGVEVVILFRERAQGGTRVSLRAKRDADVGALAARFGGGGHRRAAGLILDEPLDRAVPRILAATRELLGS
ncbi:MAG: DHH family phosphoesterase [Candidatus Brocadiia bacterium]